MKIPILVLTILGLIAVRLPGSPIDDGIFTPANAPEMHPIKSHHTPAYHEAKKFLHGANLGDYLEADPRWHATITTNDFAMIKREGFDHVRVPIGWHHYAGPAPDYVLSPEIFGKVDFVVTNLLAEKIAVMINIHHFDELDHDPAGTTGEFLAIWRQIAAHYQNFSKDLVFELDNEPHENATTALMNPIYARAIAEIRQTNPRRTIVVEPGGWGGIDELINLVLPPDENVIVSVHCYDPFLFTHQGAGWAGADSQQTGFIFPGPPAQPLQPNSAYHLKPWVLKRISDYNTLPAGKNPVSALAFTGRLKYVHDWSEYYGRPVHLGEFGAYTKGDQGSRASFYAAFRQACEQEHLGWCIWDWNSGFRYWDEKLQQPLPGMRDALFGSTH
jgi:endoglucanase